MTPTVESGLVLVRRLQEENAALRARVALLGGGIREYQQLTLETCGALAVHERQAARFSKET